MHKHRGRWGQVCSDCLLEVKVLLGFVIVGLCTYTTVWTFRVGHHPMDCDCTPANEENLVQPFQLSFLEDSNVGISS